MKALHILTLFIVVSLIAGSCSKSNSSPDAFKDSGTTGIGGSLARFTIVNDHLFTVSDRQLSVYDITQANNPTLKSKKEIGFGVETIFPYGDNLFIGTQTGMQILNVDQPTDPVLLSSFQHIRSCDPVVANQKYAYITLRTDNFCTRGLNELQILDVSDLLKPILVKSYTMIKPQGLALEGTNLFICDNVLKWYDVSDPQNLVSKGTFITNATDLIVHNNILMVIGTGGLSQYSYNTGEIKLISRIPTTL
ncbi:MAG: hypothetical protein WKF66_17690 [Pedobacter sp.]